MEENKEIIKSKFYTKTEICKKIKDLSINIDLKTSKNGDRWCAVPLSIIYDHDKNEDICKFHQLYKYCKEPENCPFYVPENEWEIEHKIHKEATDAFNKVYKNDDYTTVKLALDEYGKVLDKYDYENKYCKKLIELHEKD